MKQGPLYPYEVSDVLSLVLSDFDDPTSGEEVAVRTIGKVRGGGDDGLDGEVPSYDITGVASWKKLTFKLVASLSDTELGRILPSTSDVTADTAMVVLMTCAQTRYRHGVRLSRSSTGDWIGHATLQRHDVRGSVLLRPQLIRTTGIPAGEPMPYAAKVGAIIATGDPTVIYVDTQPKLGLSAAVTMQWEDFSNSSDPWRREHPDDVYHLEPFGLEPRLWLNSRYVQLRDVLDATAKRGPEAVLRDTLGMLIAQPVMMQLSVSALTSVELDQDSGSAAVPSGWRSDLVASLLPALYPEEASEEDQLRRVAEEIRDGDGAASLMSRLGSVVQEMVSSFKTVETAVRTFEVTRDSAEGRDD